MLYPQWVSVWDATVLVDPAEVDVAHMVPLEEAWYSGAWAWTAKQRRDFANDLSNSISLRVLTASYERGAGIVGPGPLVAAIRRRPLQLRRGMGVG